ncbi:MAG: DNA polymerase III subunit beta [Acidobacteria bacterium]|nr:DNA polymerase III subunit beta [Acidobacteriota bacterium]
MDFSVKRSDLLKELSYVQGVVERKSTIPILSNLLLETRGTDLLVTATDLDVSIECSCVAAIKVSGSLAVSARKLFEIVRLLPDSDVHFKSLEKEWIQITCEKSRFKIVGLSRENFPAIPAIKAEALNLPSDALRYMISRCIFAITQEESRYSLNGSLMVLNANSLAMVTTDGHRLVFISRAVPVRGLQGEMRVLVAKKTLGELAKLLVDVDGDVQFGSDENHLSFKTGKRLLVSRVLAGQFPNYEMVMPRENNNRVVVNTPDFCDALRRVATMADERSRAVKLSFKDSQLDIQSSSADFGEAREAVGIQYSGEEIEISFNAQYLLDFLSVLDDDEVQFDLKDRETQGLLSPRKNTDYAYQYVVMPMKL